MSLLFNSKVIYGGIFLATLSGCSPDKTNEQTTTATPPVAQSTAINYQLATAEITNANDFALQQEAIYFPFYDLGITAEAVKNLNVLADGVAQASQSVDSDGDGTLDGLLLAADFNPAEIKSFTISSDPTIAKPALKKQTQAEISVKEGGEWKGKEYVGGTFKNVQSVTPPPQYTDHSFWIRYEGPGIESDKVAYRVYLDWRNGFDIFGKKTKDMVLQNVGLDGYDSYHLNSDWGVDVLKVGKSLGMGGFGFWNGKSVDLVSLVDTRDAIITNNGDIYSGFKINYNGWQINNQKVDLAAHFTMNAGSRLVNVQLKASQQLPNLAIGLVKHQGTTLLEGNQNVSGYAWTYVASWGKQSLSGEDDHLGMAVIFRRDDRAEQTTDENSYVSVMKDKGGELEYYFLAAWEHELDGIKTEADFKAYLDREVERLTKTPRVRFESTLSANAKKNPLDADTALAWAKKLADSELERKTLNYHYQGWDEYRKRPGKFEYDVVGMQIAALQELNAVSPNPAYTKALETVTGSYIRDDGHIHTFEPDLFSIDLTKPGQMVILLEQQTGAEKYRKAVDFLRENLKRHPRTSGGAFWHRATYPNQLWLDGVYMGIPFLAQYASIYETGEQQHASFKEAVHEFVIAREQLRDPETGLYYHAWDESKQAPWAHNEHGRASQFWSRGIGWYAMALVDVLDFIPESETELRKTLIDNTQELAADILRYQDEATGTWWQIMNKPGAIANYRESTASAMFTYFYTKAVNKGYLPEPYREVAMKSYQGMINEFVTVHADGKISMNDQCLVAGLGFGRDGSYDYYMTERIVSNDAKGNTPFILAGVEMYKLLKQ
ncbi:glycoside hydrolase family 88 protein [Cellvibrio sp. OA-2007]|uniref:glycoside hydrolase family 88 protein n=1 Tax=Cellvibrio sp. OA-2007 TaxID=529823 RepID=UPI0007859CEC|nr:glycoside hydrolase family 88 protein [Cellvibrio sp. OA-2007]